MYKTLLLLCVAALVVGSSGCGCCRGLFGSKRTAAKPVFAPAAAICNPCDACSNTCGDASYGGSGQVFSYPTGGATVSYPMMPMTGG